MFVYIALLSAFGTAVQNVLMAKFARLGDALSMSLWRSVTLMISLLPLLFLADYTNMHITLYALMPLIAAGIVSAIAYRLFMSSFKYLAIGISSAIRYAINVIVVTGISRYFFAEILSAWHIFFMVLLVGGGAMLSLSRVDFHHLENQHFSRGMFLVIISGILVGIAYTLLAYGARNLDPYFAGYFREMIILIALIIMGWIRKISIGIPIESINTQQLIRIFRAASPTLLATGGFTLATTLGPVGVVSAITVTGLLITTLLSIFLYHEHLKYIHYVGIVVISIGIVGIKIGSRLVEELGIIHKHRLGLVKTHIEGVPSWESRKQGK